MDTIKITYPNWYDELAEFEHEEKGYLEGVELSTNVHKAVLNFYNIARLTQDADNDVQNRGFFYMKNIVIVESVTRENIEASARRIVKVVLK